MGRIGTGGSRLSGRGRNLPRIRVCPRRYCSRGEDRTLPDYVFGRCVIGSRNQKNHEGESNTSRGKDQWLQPSRRWRDGNFVESSADAGEERWRNVHVGGGVQAGIDGGKERLFLFERGAAGIAGGEVRAQLALRAGTGGRRFDQRIFIVFA